ncbi:hypothetical protein HWV62_26408 [Athelia sp. TMB]|nr:hypothetical protein HWV62_26408 [Athelia sp. TMB]
MSSYQTPSPNLLDIDHPDADILVRSADGVNYRTFRFLLSMASPILKDMFGLPRQVDSESTNGVDEILDGLPVVQFAEDSATLRHLLPLCYPVSYHGVRVIAKPNSLAEVNGVLKAARKYEMDGAFRIAVAWLLDPAFLTTEPLRVFTIACFHRLSDEASTAARCTLVHPILHETNIPEISSINAGLLQSVLLYHRHCVQAAIAVVENLDSWMSPTTSNLIKCTKGENQIVIASSTFSDSTSKTTRRVCVHHWLSQYMTSIKTALPNFCSGAAAKDVESLARALVAVVKCPVCSTPSSDSEGMGRTFPKFVEVLATKIEQEISKVSSTLLASQR